MIPLRVFVGFDQRETIAFHVLAHSIMTRASGPVAIIPLVRSSLASIHKRPRGEFDSTDFAITRFLVPALSGYEGISIFMDSDMLCLADIYDVLQAADQTTGAVAVCQHQYVPKTERKFFDQQQTDYPRKNWSSFMVFDNARCRALTPEYVDSAPGLDLHGFKWLKDNEIGSLPLVWNWLVGEYPYSLAAKILHYTIGGPWITDFNRCDRADDWLAECSRLVWNGGVHHV